MKTTPVSTKAGSTVCSILDPDVHKECIFHSDKFYYSWIQSTFIFNLFFGASLPLYYLGVFYY